MAKISNAFIYAFYLLVLLLAVGYRFGAESLKTGEIYDLSIVEDDSQTNITFYYTDTVKSQAEFLASEGCLRLSFNEAAISERLIKRAFAGKAFKALFLAKADGADKTVKALLYPQSGRFASIKKLKGKTVVKLLKNESFNTETNELRALLNPFEDINSPVVVELVNAPLAPVLNELAELGKINLYLSKDICGSFSGSFQAAAPAEALRQIVEGSGLELIRGQKQWLVKQKAKAQ